MRMPDSCENVDEPKGLPAEPRAFADAVEQAARQLFRGTKLNLKLSEVTQRLVDDCQRLRERAANPTPSIAVVGGVGEGKSWLAGCLLEKQEDNETVCAELKSAQGKSLLTWFGHERPLGLDEDREQFLQVPQARMLDLGRPYVVGDTPGFTDVDAGCRRLSGVAATSAPIKILVTSITELRDGRYDDFVKEMDGALILPVVRFEPVSRRQSNPDDESCQDVSTRIKRWQRAAPSAEFLDPCFMPMQRIFGPTETENLMRDRLREALTPQMRKVAHLRRSADRQVGERIRQARREVAVVLEGFRNRVGSYVEGLDELTDQLPDWFLHELLGEDLALRMSISQRFRADWISRTWLVCFPYRSFLGILALTAGAWDRLVLSFAGSLPSLVLTVFQSMKNVRDEVGSMQRLREGVTARIQGRIEDEIRPKIRNLQIALSSTLPEQHAMVVEPLEPSSGFVRIRGLEKIDAESSRIIGSSIQECRARPWIVGLFASIGTGAFVYLITGPAVSIYRSYLQSHWAAVWDGATWSEFPTPSASMLLVSLLLSLVPTFLVSLVAIWWSCRSDRVERALLAIKSRHIDEIKRRSIEGSLCIVLTDPLVDAARFLLTVKNPEGELQDQHLIASARGTETEMLKP